MASTVKRLPQQFVDFPLDHTTGWSGYSAKTDKTMLPENVMVDPAQNCLIPNGDKLVPRFGSQKYYQGSRAVLTTSGTVGNYVKYKNFFGIEMDVKAYRDPTQGEQVLVLFNNVYVPITVTTNTSVNGTQKIYFTTYTDDNLDVAQDKRLPRLIWVNGYENSADDSGIVFSWTGGISAISAIASNVITIPAGQTFRKLGFTENFPNTGQIVVTINGVEYYSTNVLATIGYSTLVGNFAVGETVIDIVTNATAVIMSNTGSSMTVDDVTGLFNVGNGIKGLSSNATANISTYAPSELDGNTLTLNTAPTAAVGDIVTSAVETDRLVAPMYHVKQNQNYAYYGNFNLRQWYMSNQFSRPSVVQITSETANQNDLIIPAATQYTGTGQHNIVVTIDSVTPAANQQTFTSNQGGSNTSYFDASGYTGLGNNTYRISIISDCIFTPSAGSGSYVAGEFIIGQTSGTVLKVICGGNFAGGGCLCQYISGTPTTGENFIGTSSGTSRVLFGFIFENAATFFKNGVQVLGLTGMSNFPPVNGVLQFGVVGNQINTPSQIDGLQFVTTQLGGNYTGDYYELDIQTEQPDTFQWTLDGAVQQTFVPIATATATLGYSGLTGIFAVGSKVTGSTSTAFGFVQSNTGSSLVLYGVVGDFQSGEAITQTIPAAASATLSSVTQTTSSQYLTEGVSIQFTSDTGHTVGDTWTISVNQAVARSWANFYYTLDTVTQQSVRRPGEGYIYNLPSNFWTADTFENSMYVNTWTGDWSYTTPKVAANLLTEDISLTPLKQVYSSRVLYPYLTGHSLNDLIYIDESHNIVSMGRKELIQLVQSEPISDEVIDKFQSLSFLDGSIIWQNNAINFTSPHDKTMMVYNTRKSYWQPPQVIPNLGFLTVIDTNLYSHSTTDTATRMLNDPTASGDDGVKYTVIAREPDFAHGDWVGRYVMFYGATRWNKKAANMAFWEGYVYAPMPKNSMILNVYLDPGGCSGVKSAFITPKFFADETNQGNLGGGSNGSHVFGSAPTDGQNYARFQFDDMGTVNFYFTSMEFTCTALIHSYEILSMGLNLAESKFNNKEGRPDRDIDDFLPLNSQSTGNPIL